MALSETELRSRLAAKIRREKMAGLVVPSSVRSVRTRELRNSVVLHRHNEAARLLRITALTIAPGRTREVVAARAALSWVMHDLLGCSYPEIAACVFPGKGHASAITAARRFRETIDQGFRDEMTGWYTLASLTGDKSPMSTEMVRRLWAAYGVNSW